MHAKPQISTQHPKNPSSRFTTLRSMTTCGCRPELLLGEDIMINVRKLRVLQRKGEEMERQKVVEKTRKYLASVGDRVKAVATQEHTRRDIWKVG